MILDTNVDYYLRGEDFSKQWMYFFANYKSGFQDLLAEKVDFMLDEVFDA